MRDMPQHEIIESALFSAICDVRQHMREIAGDRIACTCLSEDLDLLVKTVSEINDLAKVKT